MTPEEQARLLARWLDHPSEPVADGLDEDVVEAVVALRPELAPPPRVTPDEILALVSTGPLAGSAVVDEAPVAPEVEAEPPQATPEASAEVVAFPRRHWGRWAAGGVVGLMVAAAAALIVVVPSTLFLTGTGEPDPLAAAPAAEATAPAKKDAASAPAQEWLDGDAVADLDEGEASEEERLGSLGYLEAAPAPEALARAPTASAGPRTSSSAGRELIPEVHATAEAEVEYDAVADLDLAEKEEAREDLEYAPEPAVASGVVAKSPAPATVDDAVAWEDEEVLADYDIDGSAETEAIAMSHRLGVGKAKRRDRQSRGGARAEAAPAPEEPAMDEIAVADLDEEAEYSRPTRGATTSADAPAPPPPADLSSLRAAAMPTDYAPSHGSTLDGSTRAGLDASQDKATELAGERRFGEAGDALASHISPPAEVGMDQAAQAAKYYLYAGDPSRAVAACQAGLSLSTANTAARSYLLTTYGDALRQTGDTTGAEAAYLQAIALNEARVPSLRYYDSMETLQPAGH